MKCNDEHESTLTKVAGVCAVLSSAEDVGAVLLEVAAHERVEALVARRVLHEARLVAEGVAAIATRAVEMRLVLPVGQIYQLINKRNERIFYI